jgi:hypothetical protein
MKAGGKSDELGKVGLCEGVGWFAVVEVRAVGVVVQGTDSDDAVGVGPGFPGFFGRAAFQGGTVWVV